MRGARAAGAYQRAFQRGAGTVSANSGIPSGNAMPMGKVGQRSLIQIDLADELSVVRSKGGQYRFDAMAHEAKGRRIMRGQRRGLFGAGSQLCRPAVESRIL